MLASLVRILRWLSSFITASTEWLLLLASVA
jgi:hypothetical protein